MTKIKQNTCNVFTLDRFHINFRTESTRKQENWMWSISDLININVYSRNVHLSLGHSGIWYSHMNPTRWTRGGYRCVSLQTFTQPCSQCRQSDPTHVPLLTSAGMNGHSHKLKSLKSPFDRFLSTERANFSCQQSKSTMTSWMQSSALSDTPEPSEIKIIVIV